MTCWLCKYKGAYNLPSKESEMWKKDIQDSNLEKTLKKAAIPISLFLQDDMYNHVLICLSFEISRLFIIVIHTHTHTHTPTHTDTQC